MRIPSTIRFKRGDIVLLPFPFTDQSGIKRRPVVFLSANEYNIRRRDLVVAPITSNISSKQLGDTVIGYWAETGLLKTILLISHV